MVNHLTNGPAFGPIPGVQLRFGKRFNPLPKVPGKSFDVPDPGLDVALLNASGNLESTDRVTQFLHIQRHSPRLSPLDLE